MRGATPTCPPTPALWLPAPATLCSSMVSSAVYEAISSGRGLEMHYQPIVSLDATETRYYEALARIRL